MPEADDQRHVWTFLLTTRSDVALLVAICGRCGLMRRASVREGLHFPLGGDCPGTPQEAEAPPAPMVG